MSKSCLFIAVGNSRLHCAWCKNKELVLFWDAQHFSNKVERSEIPLNLLSNKLIEQKLTNIPVFVASVVPKQTEFWANYANCQVITLKDIKLQNIYSTLGIDRALSVWGGGETYGYPCLVIDGGTALTFTGVDRQKQLIGGAILPGLRTQFLTLNQKTAALPEVSLPATLPPRWASNTEKAIASGIIYTTIAGIYSYIQNWQRQYPDSQIILTGGDAEILSTYLRQQYSELKIKSDRNLIFYGMQLATSSFL
ncbi:pantothenate kinase [Waterburya agarophytonicola K14]|uniref:Type III pantothenate kinase n=1 Tax=Waterburya agarophytonicola KI4 TaxID=2874699 RepID=A0A964FKU3_9CYAN|nr:pantothenate kinase [Waterburya agarophytonicola]MCC0178978.1 pantothenate kinase [Waterburya agarophytonicola KI4]